MEAILNVTPAPSQADGPAAPLSRPEPRPAEPSFRPDAGPAGGPQSFLERAIIQLESCDSISAKTRQSAELFGKRLVGSGTYLERRSAQQLMFRLELRFQSGDREATFLQSCDGRSLWIYEDFGGRPTLAQVDIARIARALEERGEMPQAGKIGQWPGLGGLPKTLRGLHLAFDFTAAEEARLEDRLPVIRLQGEWKQKRPMRFFPDKADEIKAGRPVDLGKLPSYLPHYVVLYLEQKGLFPRRIEYWRRAPVGPRQQEPPENQLMVAMDLFDVQINVPISPARFQFDPGKLEPSNQTEALPGGPWAEEEGRGMRGGAGQGEE